jgi:hypothetical protein
MSRWRLIRWLAAELASIPLAAARHLLLASS